MGLTKQYLRYNPTAQFGVIASQRSNIVALQMRNTKARYVAVGAVENVIIWDVRIGQKVSKYFICTDTADILIHCKRFLITLKMNFIL